MRKVRDVRTNTYIIILIINFLLIIRGFFSDFCHNTFSLSSESKDAKNVKFLAIIMTFLGLFVGISDMLGGYDRYIYCDLFDSMADVTSKGKNTWKSDTFQFYGGEFGYVTLFVIITNSIYLS